MAHLYRRVGRGIKAPAAVASSTASPGLLGGLLTEKHFSPSPKLSPKSKTEVPTQISSGKDLLGALCMYFKPIKNLVDMQPDVFCTWKIFV